MDEYGTVSRALRAVNRIRREQGLPRLTRMRKGSLDRPYRNCPIARSVADDGSGRGGPFSVITGHGTWSSEHDILAFMALFDDEQLPELVLRSG